MVKPANMYTISSKNTVSFLAKQRRKLHASFMTEVTDEVLQTELYKQVISPTNGRTFRKFHGYLFNLE